MIIWYITCYITIQTFKPFPNKFWFLHVCSKSLLITLWEREKLLIWSNFNFSQCFLPFWRICCHFHQILNCHLQTLSVWIDWMVFYAALTVFQSYRSDSSRNTCLSWVSPVLGWGSEVSYLRTLPQKNPEDPVRLEPRTPGLRVKHFTFEQSTFSLEESKIYRLGKGQLSWERKQWCKPHFLLPPLLVLDSSQNKVQFFSHNWGLGWSTILYFGKESTH